MVNNIVNGVFKNTGLTPDISMGLRKVKMHGKNCECITPRMCLDKAYLQKDRMERLYLRKTNHSNYLSNRIARIKENGGNHTRDQWEGLIKSHPFCAGCSAVGVKLYRDHIAPLFHGGSDDIGNIQPLCLRCNFRKGRRKDFKSMGYIRYV